MASARRKTLIFGTLLVDAHVFVLAELPRLDLVLPAGAVALGPLAAAVGERRVVPGRRVGLALVLAFLEVGDLVALGAGRKPEHGNQQQDPDHDLPRPGCCAGGCAPGLPGPQAQPQPHTSEPLPRRTPRSRWLQRFPPA